MDTGSSDFGGQRDAERSKQRLLDAAAEEFAAHGVSGARVAVIAQRAGVNAQLISYYFGGKQGLYDALMSRWHEQEPQIAAPEQAFADVLAGYVDVTLTQRPWTRLLLRTGLDAPDHAFSDQHVDPGTKAALEDIRRRQEAGEISADFEAGFVLLVCMAVAAAPLSLPHVIPTAFGTSSNTEEFQLRFTAQLQQLFAPREHG